MKTNSPPAIAGTGPPDCGKRNFFWEILKMAETIEGPVIREVGNNPPIDDSIATRIGTSKTGLFQRIGKVFRSDEPAPPVRQPAALRLSAAEELAELKPRMAHYQTQYAAARASAEAGNSAPITGGDINFQKKRLVGWLNTGRDVAAETSVDSNFLASILNDCQGGGLIPAMRERIGFLERQQAADKLESDKRRRRQGLDPPGQSDDRTGRGL